MSEIARQFGPPPAPGLLAPESEVLLRLQADGASDADKAEALRVARAVAATFEEACGRPLLRREGVDLDFVADDDGGLEYSARFGAWRIDMDFAFPVESVASVTIDSDATSVFEIDFDTADAIDAADYRLLWLDGLVLFINSTVDLPPTEAGEAVRVRVTCGYEPRGDGEGWTPTGGARPMPADLEEAFLEQAALLFKRRLAPHVRSEGRPVGGGAATSSYATSDLTPNVRATLARYATWQCALNLQTPGAGGDA